MNKLTPEMRAALRTADGGPIEFQDDETQQIYVLIEAGSAVTLPEQYIAAEVQKGLEAIDRGEVADWDPEEIKQAGRKLLSDNSE